MKYKVVLYNNESAANVDTAANFTFYTYNQALLCAQEWVTLGALFRALVWDGIRWTAYQP
jgi:hypothetical protein